MVSPQGLILLKSFCNSGQDQDDIAYLRKLCQMKIDMTPEAITRRLKIENAQKRACLSLANSSSGKEKLKKFSADKMVLRTVRSIGR